jgi:hypothetical protein
MLRHNAPLLVRAGRRFYRARPHTQHDRGDRIKSPSRRDDGSSRMQNGATFVFYPKGYFPPASGAERMRDLRRRNPSYDAAYNAQRRAWRAAFKAKRKAEQDRVFAEMMAQIRAAEMLAQQAPAQKTPLLLLPAPAPRLALPAPVIDVTVAAIDALAERHRSVRVEVMAARGDVVSLPVR